MKYQAKIILVIVAVLTCVAPSAGQNTSATPVDGEKLKVSRRFISATFANKMNLKKKRTLIRFEKRSASG
jgi:hypothetical protein